MEASQEAVWPVWRHPNSTVQVSDDGPGAKVSGAEGGDRFMKYLGSKHSTSLDDVERPEAPDI